MGVSHLYTNVFGMPARRPAALIGAATVLAAGALVGATAVPANADGGSKGSASAVNARVGLDVALLKGGVNVPVKHTLNEVQAPESSEKTLLEAEVDGYHKGKPFTFVSAKVAKAAATVDAKKAEGDAKLVEAVVKVPGLPLTPVLKAELITAKATCAVGATPVADAKVPGTVVVLGKKVVLDAKGTVEVKVPGVGKVNLTLSEETVTSDTAAATAIRLKVAVDPLKLNVAKVTGEVVVSEAKCTTPGSDGGTSGGSTQGSSGGDTAGSSGGDDGGSTEGGSGGDTKGTTAGTTSGSTAGSSGGDTAGTSGADGGATSGDSAGGNDPGTQTGDDGNLAETGSSGTLALGGAGAALIVGGGIALWMRRRSAASQG